MKKFIEPTFNATTGQSATEADFGTFFPVLTNIFPVLSRHFQFYSVILQQK